MRWYGIEGVYILTHLTCNSCHGEWEGTNAGDAAAPGVESELWVIGNNISNKQTINYEITIKMLLFHSLLNAMNSSIDSSTHADIPRTSSEGARWRGCCKCRGRLKTKSMDCSMNHRRLERPIRSWWSLRYGIVWGINFRRNMVYILIFAFN